MLAALNISNIALITKCNLTLNRGLNILTGETGAGKSIIIDSLTFALGDRADKSLIRSGETTATVEAVFEINPDEGLFSCLKELGIQPEETLILRRTMTVEGRNECRINGRTVTLTMLKAVTAYLADIYGQHEHQTLINVSEHIKLLDNYGAHHDEIERVNALYNQLNDINSRLSRFGSEDEIRRKLDMLKYQIDEITGANVKDGEEAELLATRAKYMSAGKIIGSVSGAYNALSGNEGSVLVESALSTARANLSSVAHYDKALEELYQRIDSALIEISDITGEIKSYVEDFDYDERKADMVEKRLDEIRLLHRKYGELNAFLIKAQKEYDLLNNSSDIIEELKSKYDKIKEELIKQCTILSDKRRAAAVKFEKAILSELKDLGMGGTAFKVSINSDSDKISNDGYDEVEFLISPNPGEPLKPLSKIISGGEMSRFMLALKNITAALDNIDCMVFDEIDSGISGHIAQIVSEKLCNISRDRQVIAVTHLPQLAAMADNHYLIEKSSTDNKTVTEIIQLDEAKSVAEVARLIGGRDYSGYALPHAREMKAYSDKYKLSILG